MIHGLARSCLELAQLLYALITCLRALLQTASLSFLKTVTGVKHSNTFIWKKQLRR
jgi:hypothetical protein